MSASLHRIVYISGEAVRFSNPDLQELLSASRRNNEEQDITGLLLYKDGNFMQVIEGPRPAVDGLFEKIRADQRHRRVIPVIDEPIAHRDFSGWSMSFRDLDEEKLAELSGFDWFLYNPWHNLRIGKYSDTIRRLLSAFAAATEAPERPSSPA